MAKAKVMQRNEAGEMVEVAIEPQLISEDLAELIGKQFDPVILEVERGAIRRYALAAQEPNPLYSDVEYAKQSKHGEIICPPCFFGWPIKPRIQSQSLFDLIKEKTGRSTGMDNGGEIEFILPVRAGDTLTSVTRIADIFEEIGRSGNRLLLIIQETTYVNQNGDTVARSRSRALLI